MAKIGPVQVTVTFTAEDGDAMLTSIMGTIAGSVGAGGFTSDDTPQPACAVTGTVTSADEDGIVAGGYTLVLTLTADTWAPTIGADNSLTTGLIAGIDSGQSEDAGWDDVVKAGLTHANVARTSDTVVTITIPAFAGFAITASETITVTVPADNLDYSSTEVTASPTFSITNVAETCVTTGTATSSATAADIVAGGLTVILTVAGDQWVSTLGANNAATTALLAGIDSAQSEAAGWDAEVKANLDYTMLTRDSATQCTLVLPASASYLITATETITVTVPAAALLASSSPVVSSPTLTVEAVGVALTGTVTSADQDDIVAGARTIILTLSGGVTWDATLGADNGVTTAFIAAFDSAQSEAAGWDAVVKVGIMYTAVTRTSSTVATVVLPAFAGYAVTATETITATVPASAITGYGVALVADTTFTVTNVAEAVALSGGVIDGPPTEAHIVEGGKTIVLTVSGDQWVATLGDNNQITTDFLAAIDSAQSEAAGWDAEVKANLTHAMLTRDSAQQVTLTLPALASYDITGTETITATPPATSLLASSAPIAASPTFSVAAVTGDPVVSGATGTFSDDNAVTISGSGFRSTGPSAELLKDAIEAGVDGASFAKTGWNQLYPEAGRDALYSADDSYRKTQSIAFVFQDYSFEGLQYDFGSGIEEIYFTAWVNFDKNDNNTKFQWKTWRVSNTSAYAAEEAGIIGDTWWISDELKWGNVDYKVYIDSAPDTAYGLHDDAYLFNTWMRLEWYYKKGTTNNYDGTVLHNRIGFGSALNAGNRTNVLTHTTANASDLWRYLIFGQAYSNLEPGTERNCIVYWDDVYVSQTRARVELGNNSVFANCTVREIQEVTSWSDTSIGVTFNQGNFAASTTAYLFVVDQDGTASGGYEVTIA